MLAPAFSAGHVTGAQLAYVVGSLALVAVLTSLGVVVRRAAAGAVMFRLQARYRRAVTRQYLRLPLAWHHRHPAGQLLSNANADVEAIWQVFAPLPMAIGVVVMLVVAAAAMLAADPLLGAVGLLVLPAVFAANVVFQRVMSPRVVRAQQLRASVSEVAHESFEGAVVVKTLGREAAETSRFGVVAGELRDANVAVGVTRGFFDPVLEALPGARDARRPRDRHGPDRRRRGDHRRTSSRSPTCSRWCRSRSARSAGCSVSCPGPSSDGNGSPPSWPRAAR